MYKKILAPLDGSDFAECSLAHVKAIAGSCSVPEAVLLYVVEPLRSAGYSEAGIDPVKVEQANADYGKRYVAEMADALNKDGLTVKTAVRKGYPPNEILDYAAKNGVDLIIMSTHGTSGVAKWLIGSVSERIVRHSSIPVMLVTPEECRVKG